MKNALEINKAIKMIDLICAPHQTMMIGPKATFGKLFKIVRYGSNTLDKKLFHHNILAIIIPIIIDNVKLIRVSYSVTNMWLNKLLSFAKFIIVLNIKEGDDAKKVFIILYFANNSHMIINVINISICVIAIKNFFFFFFFRKLICSLLYNI